MDATVKGHRKETLEASTLEAEVAAWRSKRGARPVSICGIVPVVRLRRRVRPTSWSSFSVDRTLAAAPR